MQVIKVEVGSASSILTEREKGRLPRPGVGAGGEGPVDLGQEGWPEAAQELLRPL